MSKVPISRAAYRLLLHIYPREFRQRFAADLEADFIEMIETRGRRYVWQRVLSEPHRRRTAARRRLADAGRR